MKTQTTLRSGKFTPPHFYILLTLVCMLFNSVLNAQVSITPSSNADDMIPWLTTSFDKHETAIINSPGCTTANCTSGMVIATVFDGPNAGILITDGALNYDYLPFGSLTFPSGSPTTFSNPDVVLLQGGTKAIVTFETNATNNAYVVELDIDLIPMTVSYGAGYFNYINTTQPASEPHIDSDPINDRFMLVSTQNNGTYNETRYSMYVWAGTNYNPLTGYNNITVNSTLNGTEQVHPDAALGYVSGSGDPEWVVSYIDNDNSNTNGAYLNVVYFDLTSSNQVLNYQLSATNGLTNLDTRGYPRIASEQTITGGANNMQWSVAMSLLGTVPFVAYDPHLLYIHSNNLGGFFTDDPMGTTQYRSLFPALDWMTGGGNNDAFVAWSTHFTPKYDYVGVLNPYTNAGGGPPYYYNTWEQIPYLLTLTQNDHVSVCTDETLGRYIVSYEVYDNLTMDKKIYYKLRTVGTTGFKSIPFVNSFPENAYPNPCINYTNVYSSSEDIINIYDVSGKKVKTYKTAIGWNKVNTQDLMNGFYYIKLNDNIQTIQVNK